MVHTEDMGSQQAHLLLFRGCALTVKSTNWWPLLGKCLQKATHPSVVWLVTVPLWCKGRSVRETVGRFCPGRFPLSSWPTTCLPSVQHLNLIMHRIHKFIKNPISLEVLNWHVYSNRVVLCPHSVLWAYKRKMSHSICTLKKAHKSSTRFNISQNDSITNLSWENPRQVDVGGERTTYSSWLPS